MNEKQHLVVQYMEEVISCSPEDLNLKEAWVVVQDLVLDTLDYED